MFQICRILYKFMLIEKSELHQEIYTFVIIKDLYHPVFSS